MSHLAHLRTSIPGPKSHTLAGQLHKLESRNITAITDDWPIFWERAFDSNVWDADGNRYIDLTASFGVANVDHSNSRVILIEETNRTFHPVTCNRYNTAPENAGSQEKFEIRVTA